MNIWENLLFFLLFQRTRLFVVCLRRCGLRKRLLQDLGFEDVADFGRDVAVGLAGGLFVAQGMTAFFADGVLVDTLTGGCFLHDDLCIDIDEILLHATDVHGVVLSCGAGDVHLPVRAVCSRHEIGRAHV